MFTPDVVTLVFAAALLGGMALRLWLATRQIRHVARHRDAVPADFATTIPLASHQKAADYTVAKARFGIAEMAWSAAIVLGWTLLGGLDALNTALRAAGTEGMLRQVVLVAAFSVIGAVLDMPASLYQNFVLERNFGFSRMTLAQWLRDVLLTGALATVVGLPVVWVILWLMGAAGSAWWLYAWLLWVGFNLLLLVIYPTVIAPLFNRFEPLDDPALRDRVLALMQRCGFSAKGLFVMDGSKRSAHSNAYFTGFGRSKRVVFYDTLLARLSPEEVDAVLAHELGHFRHRHVLKRMVSLFLFSLLGFALLGWLSNQPAFYLGLGVRPQIGEANDALALLLFLMVAPMFGLFVSPLFASASRRHEFEADAFAASQTASADLRSALLKLYEDNASTLTPDPLFVRFYYSHPPASQRLARMAH